MHFRPNLNHDERKYMLAYRFFQLILKTDHLWKGRYAEALHVDVPFARAQIDAGLESKMLLTLDVIHTCLRKVLIRG